METQHCGDLDCGILGYDNM